MTIEFEPQQKPKAAGGIQYSHDKSDQVKGSLSTKDAFKEDYERPALLWFPIILFVLSSLDYGAMFNNDEFAEKFFNGDPTWPLIAGVTFLGLYIGAAAGLYFRRRWSVWMLIGTVILELGFYFLIAAGGATDVFAQMRVPMITEGTDLTVIAGVNTGIPSGFILVVRSMAYALIALLCLPVTEFGRSE